MMSGAALAANQCGAVLKDHLQTRNPAVLVTNKLTQTRILLKYGVYTGLPNYES